MKALKLKTMTKMILFLVAVPSLLMLYQNCGQKSFQFSASDASVDAKTRPTNLDGGPATDPGVDGGTPVINPPTAFGPGTGTSNLTPHEMQKLCPIIEEIDVTNPSQEHEFAQPNPVNEFTITGSSNFSEILGNIVHLTIKNFSGHVVAKAEHLVELNSFSGKARIAAQDSGDISSFSGNICLSTNSVGNISNGSGKLNIIGPKGASGQGGDITSRSGLTYISGLNLGSISDSSGRIEIVGGSVQAILGGSGDIILDNVQVDTIDGTNRSGVIILKNGTTVKNRIMVRDLIHQQ